MNHSLIRLCLFACLSLTVPSVRSEETRTLPRTPAAATVSGRDNAALWKYFGGMKTLPSGLDSPIERILLAHVPEEYRLGCTQMIRLWGAGAKASPATAIRIIHLETRIERPRLLILAFTCYSSAGGYGDRFYDERLAFLAVDSASSSIAMTPESPPCAPCSELTSFGFGEELLIGGLPAVSILARQRGDNPCCPRHDSLEDVSVHYFTLQPSGLRKMLSVTAERRAFIPDIVRGDSTGTYRAEISHENDPAGSLIRVTAQTEETVRGKILRRGLRVWIWNRKSRGFLEGAP